MIKEILKLKFEYKLSLSLHQACHQPKLLKTDTPPALIWIMYIM